MTQERAVLAGENEFDSHIRPEPPCNFGGALDAVWR